MWDLWPQAKLGSLPFDWRHRLRVSLNQSFNQSAAPTGSLTCDLRSAGAEFVPPVLGPMANSIADLELFCKGVIAAEPWRMDPSCLPLPWTPFRIERGQTLRIGVMLDNGLVRPQPPVARGVRDTAEKLRRAGHEGACDSLMRISSSCVRRADRRQRSLSPIPSCRMERVRLAS